MALSIFRTEAHFRLARNVNSTSWLYAGCKLSDADHLNCERRGIRSVIPKQLLLLGIAK